MNTLLMIAVVAHTSRHLKFNLDFDDLVGTVGYKPKLNILLGNADMARKISIAPKKVSPCHIVIDHPQVTGTGFEETCVRAFTAYSIRNDLVVRLDDGVATVRLGERFTLPVTFSNVSFPLDKNDKRTTLCEDELTAKGLYSSSDSNSG